MNFVLTTRWCPLLLVVPAILLGLSVPKNRRNLARHGMEFVTALAVSIESAGPGARLQSPSTAILHIMYEKYLVIIFPCEEH